MRKVFVLLLVALAIVSAVDTELQKRRRRKSINFIEVESNVLTESETNSESERKSFVPPTDSDVQNQWAAFKNNNGKQFGSIDEAFKFKKFSDNINLIAKENFNNENNGLSLRLGINQFADLSPEEWFAYSHGTSPTLEEPVNFLEVESTGNLRGSLVETQLPTSVNWATSGNVNPPKNQGACGSCWAFCSTTALESLYKIKNPTKPLQIFSQQQVLDCTLKTLSTYGMYGCSGGSITTAFNYFSKSSIALNSTYPYTGKNGTSCQMTSAKIFWKNTGYYNVPRNNSIQLQTIVAQQPVAVSLWASTSQFQLYKSGVFFQTGCGIQTNGALTTNHGVLITGYGVNVVNSTYSENYWIVQNSWGATWGNGGYIWVGYKPDTASTTATNPGTCGIHLYPAYPYL